VKEMNLIESLVKAQSEMTHAHFDQTNPHFKSKFASLKSVIDAVKPALNSNGIFFMQISHPVDTGVGIETVFCKGDEKLSTGVVVVPVDRANAQGLGSSMTYAKRYSLAVACGISASEDDDGNAAAESPPPINAIPDVDVKKRDSYVTQLITKANQDSYDDACINLLEELIKDKKMKVAVWGSLDAKTQAFLSKQGR
jgi:hypothetical protein